MDHLQTEARNPASLKLDELTPLGLVRLMNAEDSRVIPAVASQENAIAQAIEIIAERLRNGGRLIYIGAGTSGRLGVLDATECPPTFNTPPELVVGLIAGGPSALTRAVEGAEDRPESGTRDLAALGFSAKDVLVGIATSGRTPYVLGAVAYARNRGAFTIGLSCNPDSELSRAVDLPITPVVGPEVLSGSTRLKAGTATKLVLNMLTTGAMVRLGKTFGNLMVDLRATNSKLRARTNRIVRQLAGLDLEQADELLARCNGELKTALVAQLATLTPDEARARLQTADGQVGKALGARSVRSRAEMPALTSSGAQNLLLGIDGGGTSTVALLAQREPFGGWRILGRGEAGPCNTHAVGTERAFAALDTAIHQAFAAAQLVREPVASACLGLAGAGRPDDGTLVRNWARDAALAARVEITNDAALLLAAGTPSGWGLALVAGTGSIAYARSPEGRTARAGGWGYLLGDEGSGYAIALAAVQAVARAADRRGPETILTERILDAMKLGQAQELIPAVYRGGWDRAALAGMAPLVLNAAASGDAVAGEIVRSSAEELARTAVAAVRRLALDHNPIPIALTGGVILSTTTYREQVLQSMRAHGLQTDPVTLVTEPAEGALRLACQGLPAECSSSPRGEPPE
jgi:N-acetylmuramic acid 6-phosphate etherase